MVQIGNRKAFKDDTLSNRILKGMKWYRESKYHKFCDFFLQSCDGKSYPVHKIVISTACPYFATLFNINETTEIKEGRTTFSNINGESLAKLIDYMYSGEIEIDLDDMQDMFENASYLRLKNLQNFIADHLLLNINHNTCLDIWRFAETNSCTKLSNECSGYIEMHADELFNPEFFKQLEIDEIMCLLKKDKLNCSEDLLCERVIEWILIDYKNRERYVKELVNEIRFPILSDDFMLSYIYECSLLENDDVFSKRVHESSKMKLKIQQDHYVFNKSIIPRYGGCNEFIYLLYGSECHQYKDKDKDKDNQLIEKSSLKYEYLNSARTLFKGNLLFVCGGDKAKDKCQFYSPIQNEWRKFKNLQICRFNHGAVYIRDKIYVCGGQDTTSTEYFDLSNESSNIGPSMQIINYNFGICSEDDCIYTIGGHSKQINRLDIREGKWTELTDTSEEYPKACYHANSLYCINQNEGKIFDLRKNDWLDFVIPSFFNTKTKLNQYDIYFDNNGKKIYLYGVYVHSEYYKDYKKIFRSYLIGTNSDSDSWLDITNAEQTKNLTSPAVCMLYS